MIILTLIPTIGVLLLHSTVDRDRISVPLNLLWVLPFILFYAFFFFKIVRFKESSFEVVKLINPINRRNSFEFSDVEKVVVRAIGLQGGLDHIEIFLNDGRRKGIVFTMVRSDMKRLVAAFKSYGVQVDDFV